MFGGDPDLSQPSGVRKDVFGGDPDLSKSSGVHKRTHIMRKECVLHAERISITKSPYYARNYYIKIYCRGESSPYYVENVYNIWK